MSQAKLQHFARGVASNPIATAVLLSLLLHFVGIGTVELGRQFGWWDRSLRELLRSKIPEEVEKMAEQRRQLEQQQQEEEVNLVFVQVDPTSAAEAPENAKYYSSANTVASNPDPVIETEQPKIDGSQELVPQVMEVPRADQQPAPAQPPPPPPQREVMQPALAPTPEPAVEEKPGDMQMARAEPRAQPREQSPPEPEPPVERTRPLTLAAAKAQKGLIEGPKMRQEGGVKRASLGHNLDVKATPFGSYDAAFIAAVQARWFSLLDQGDFVRNAAGRVVLDFRLNRDGRITEMRVVESTVSDTLSWICQRAVLDPAPYDAFPMDLRRVMRTDYRDVRFTFYYHY